MFTINFQTLTINASTKGEDALAARELLIESIYHAAGGMGATEASAKKMLSDILPVVIKSWGAAMRGDTLIAAPDSDALRQQRSVLLKEVKERCEGSFSFRAVSKRIKGGGGAVATTYEYISRDDAEKASKEKEIKVARTKDAKAKAEAEKVQAQITEATKGMVSRKEHDALKASIIDAATCSDDDCLAMAAKWLQACQRRGLDVAGVIARNTAPAKPTLPTTGKGKGKKLAV